MPHSEFDWDEAKATSNHKKHRVTFEMAVHVLEDAEWQRYHIEEADDEHSVGEDRYITTGAYPYDRKVVLRIAWTERQDEHGVFTRIISARFATRRERKLYDIQISSR